MTVVGLVALLVHVRRYLVRDDLALTWPPARWTLIALAGLVLLLSTSDLISYMLGRPLVPPVMVEVYRAAWLPAPLARLGGPRSAGRGDPLSRLSLQGHRPHRPRGRLPRSWSSPCRRALLHVQYDWYGVVSIAVIGLYLGVVRFKTASVFVTMLLHAIANAGATLEMVVQEHWLK